MDGKLWFWILGWMLTILTVSGNALLIYLIISRKRLRNTDNMFLFSLALADLFVGLTRLPIMTACSWSPAPCKKCITTSLRWLVLNLSMTNLCALSIDRYIAIAYPYTHTVFKAKRRYFILLAAAWILPFVIHFVPFTWIYCAGMKKAGRHLLTVNLFVFKLPAFLFLLISCLKTLYIAHNQKRKAFVQLSQLKFNGFSPVETKTLRIQTQASTFAKALGIIVAIFLICYAIEVVRLICYTFHCSKYIPYVLVEVQHLLFIFNSASNPFVYAFLKQDIREELKRFRVKVKCTLT